MSLKKMSIWSNLTCWRKFVSCVDLWWCVVNLWRCHVVCCPAHKHAVCSHHFRENHHTSPLYTTCYEPNTKQTWLETEIKTLNKTEMVVSVLKIKPSFVIADRSGRTDENSSFLVRMLVCVVQTEAGQQGSRWHCPPWHRAPAHTVSTVANSKLADTHSHTGGTPSTVGSSMLGQLLVCDSPFNCTHTHVCGTIMCEQNIVRSPTLSMNNVNSSEHQHWQQVSHVTLNTLTV